MPSGVRGRGMCCIGGGVRENCEGGRGVGETWWIETGRFRRMPSAPRSSSLRASQQTPPALVSRGTKTSGAAMRPRSLQACARGLSPASWRGECARQLQRPHAVPRRRWSIALVLFRVHPRSSAVDRSVGCWRPQQRVAAASRRASGFGRHRDARSSWNIRAACH